MTLLRRILEEKRGLVTVVVVILALDFGVYVLAVYPLSNTVFQAETRAAAARDAVGSGERRLRHG